MRFSKPRALWSLSLLVVFSLLLFPQLALPHNALAATVTASDNFARANGPLGANWTDISDGGLAISSGNVIGTVGSVTGDSWNAQAFSSDQFSQVVLTSTQLTGGQWIGPAVRMQSSGQNAYVGFYYWNFGSPELMLFKRSGGGWAQIGAAYGVSALPAGTVLKLTATGSTIAFLENGVQVISATDSSLTGGAPGIMAYGNGMAGTWSGGGNSSTTYSIGGTVSGLTGTVVLQDNGGDNLSVGANGSFTFATAVAGGGAYAVTVKTNPSGQTCAVANGSGTVAAANVTSVAVSCTTNTTSTGPTASDNFARADGSLGPNWTDISDGGLAIASGNVIGTVGSVTGDSWSAQTFTSNQYSQVAVSSTQLTGGQWIGPAVRMQSSGQNAYVGFYYWNFGSPELMLFKRSGGGWAQIGAAYNVSPLPAGTLLKLTATGSTIAFLENGVQVISATDSSFTGGAPGIMAYGNGQAGNWSGGSNSSSSYSVGGTVSGLSGTVVLQDNAGDNLSVSANGSFTFATQVAGGGSYAVTVKTNPTGQTCTVANGSGTVAAANVTNVAVSCTNNSAGSFTIGGTVSGLSGTVVVQDNGGDNLSVSANGSFTFATPVAGGGSYAVTVKTNPTGQTCTVANGSGTVAAANVTSVAVSCTAVTAGTTASDNFGRANGSLGPNWTDVSDGGMAISSGAVIGTAGAVSGDFWSAQTFTSDQFSQVQVTSTQLTGGQWIGPAVRMQAAGQTAYVGLYNFNSGSPELQLFKRSGGGWAEIGSAYAVGPLPAGTQLELTAVGSTISYLENGIQVISVTDTSITGGAPGIMAYGNGQVDNWSGGNQGAPPRFQATYESTDSNGIKTYQAISSDNGYGAQEIRVLQPTNPAPGVAHNFLFVLPVELGEGTQFGDGMQTLLGANAQNQYNLTIIEPTFGTDPWYADNPSDPNVQYETYMTADLVPWAEKNLATTGTEQNWLLGFSKSGYGAQDLILKHPSVFTLAASWDFPADMSSYAAFGTDSEAGYGTDANFQANYRLTAAFVAAHAAPFLNSNRIWVGGYADYQPDDADYAALLTAQGIAHTTETPTQMTHRWDSGWVPIALAALYQDSLHL